MPVTKAPPLKKPKFGGKPKTKMLPPDKKILESFGGARTKQKVFEPRVTGADRDRLHPGDAEAGHRRDDGALAAAAGRRQSGDARRRQEGVQEAERQEGVLGESHVLRRRRTDPESLA